MTKRQWGRVDSPSECPWFDSRSNNKLDFAHPLKVIQDSLGFRPWITDFQVFLIPDFFSVELEFRIPRTGLSPKARHFRSTSKNFSDYHTWGRAMDRIWCLTPYRVNPWEVWERQHRWRVSIGLTASRQKRLLFTVNRQKWRLILIVQKFEVISVLLFLVFQLIIMDFWLLKNPALNWKTSSHVLKNTSSRLYKTLEIAYIWNYFEIL